MITIFGEKTNKIKVTPLENSYTSVYFLHDRLHDYLSILIITDEEIIHEPVYGSIPEIEYAEQSVDNCLIINMDNIDQEGFYHFGHLIMAVVDVEQYRYTLLIDPESGRTIMYGNKLLCMARAAVRRLEFVGRYVYKLYRPQDLPNYGFIHMPYLTDNLDISTYIQYLLYEDVQCDHYFTLDIVGKTITIDDLREIIIQMRDDSIIEKREKLLEKWIEQIKQKK